MKTYLHPITKEELSEREYMNVMFGEEFMKSHDKGVLKEYGKIENIK
tara:strand:+ start:149 stop:289 length:141 start_codon:yes stop_codon:yes gene_type:complete